MFIRRLHVLPSLIFLFSCLIFSPLDAPAAQKTFTDSIGVEFVLIPAGNFTMDADTHTTDMVQHPVTISKAFYLGKYEVTQAQWQKVMGNNPSRFKGENRPVEMVSWIDVQAFIKRLNGMEGHDRYRLPTEAEWEYAAKAGGKGYPFGKNGQQLKEYSWHMYNSGNTTHPVGQKKPNPWGLYDMSGNVAEWVWDWRVDYAKDVVNGHATDPQGPETGSVRMLRGASWTSYADAARRGGRTSSSPENTYHDAGFRLALTVEPPVGTPNWPKDETAKNAPKP